MAHAHQPPPAATPRGVRAVRRRSGIRAALAAVLLVGVAGAQEPAPAPTAEAVRRPNVVLLCVDDLRPELACFGAEYIHSPNIDRLAAGGRAWTRHYVQAPTCGASRFALLTGRFGRDRASRGNGALVARARGMVADTAAGSATKTTPSLPEQFRAHGYTTVAVGKVSHHPGGLFGARWNEPTKVEMPGAWTRQSMPCGPWVDPQGAMHGLAEGRVRGNKDTPAIEAFDGPDDSYPDGWITAQALRDLDALAAADAPFLLAIGLIRPHLPFGAPKRYLDLYADVELPPIPHPERPEGRTTWHGSGEFINNYVHDDRDPRRDPAYAALVRRHYAACVSYADALVGQVLARVDQLGLADDTVVVLWGDHGWHLGEHGIWGKHSLFEESLRAPLIVRAPGRPAAGTPSAAVVQSVDLYPTLCELCAVPVPAGLDGSSLVPQLDDPLAPGRAAVSYSGNADTLRTPRYRLVRHRARGDAAAFVELYDHAQPAGETANVAAHHPAVVTRLLAELDARLR